MTAEKDLHTLLATMHPVLREGEYVYALWPHGKPLAGAIAAAVREAEGLTVVLPRAEADSLGLSYDFVAAWITLQVHSSLEAIGLTAAVSAALTEAKISCNVLAGFHHDHLLVPVADTERALEVLHELVAANGEHKPAPELVLRNEEPADRPAILALTAAAFAISPVTGLHVDGEPEEVKLLRPVVRVRGIPAGVQHRGRTRRRNRGACDQHPGMGGRSWSCSGSGRSGWCRGCSATASAPRS